MNDHSSCGGCGTLGEVGPGGPGIGSTLPAEAMIVPAVGVVVMEASLSLDLHELA